MPLLTLEADGTQLCPWEALAAQGSSGAHRWCSACPCLLRMGMFSGLGCEPVLLKDGLTDSKVRSWD